MVITRPDIAKTVSELAHFMANPSELHVTEVNRSIQYLYGTRKLSVLFDGQYQLDKEFEVFTDASFADDPESRRSSQGWLMKLDGGPIAWNASRQATVTTSSTEAELLGLSFAAKETMAVARLFSGLRYHLDQQLTIWCDNKQTIRLVNTEVQRLKTALRHVDIHQCWIRQEVQKGTILVEYIQTSNMAADGLTKLLPKSSFKAFVKQLGLTDRISE
jgi:ribonuclease HI